MNSIKNIIDTNGKEITNEELISIAKEARKMSYSPYSEYAVGAALLCRSGRIYLGCNIENAAFSPTNCAERTAFFTAIANGEREFSKIAVVGGRREDEPSEATFPCGVCRQVITEFCFPDFEIILSDKGKVISYTIEELLPKSFSNKLLG